MNNIICKYLVIFTAVLILLAVVTQVQRISWNSERAEYERTVDHLQAQIYDLECRASAMLYQVEMFSILVLAHNPIMRAVEIDDGIPLIQVHWHGGYEPVPMEVVNANLNH